MFLCIGNMLGDGNANSFINFIEAAYIMPVNKAESTWQELLVLTVGWLSHPFRSHHPRAPRANMPRRHKT